MNFFLEIRRKEYTSFAWIIWKYCHENICYFIWICLEIIELKTTKKLKNRACDFVRKKERFSEQICQKGNNEREVEGFNLFLCVKY